MICARLTDTQHKQKRGGVVVFLKPAAQMTVYGMLPHWHLQTGVSAQLVPADYLLVFTTECFNNLYCKNDKQIHHQPKTQ